MLSQDQATLSVDQDLRFQAQEWVVQRVVFVALLLFMLAALLGLFAFGPLCKTGKQSPKGLLNLEYERFARFQAPLTFKVHFRQPQPAQEIPIHLNQKYLDEFKVEKIVPDPSRQEAGPDGTTYFFTTGGSQRGTVIFYLEPEGIGLEQGIVKTEGDQISFKQFVYP